MKKKNKVVAPHGMTYREVKEILGKEIADFFKEGWEEEKPEISYVISKIDTVSGEITLSPADKLRG